MWKTEPSVSEDSAVLKVIIGIHPVGTRIYDLENQLYKIIWQEKEKPILARNFWPEELQETCRCLYCKHTIGGDLFEFVLEGKLNEIVWLPHIHIILNHLCNSAFHSKEELIKQRDYSKKDINYLEGLGRKLDFRLMGWGL